MRFWSLLVWVTQFGFSVAFPLCFFLVLASWLRSTYDLGSWIVVLFGVFGLLTTVGTVRSCILALRKEADKAASQKKSPEAYNKHD